MLKRYGDDAEAEGVRRSDELPVRSGASSSDPADGRAREALGHYDRAIDRLKVGDRSGFGAELDALRPNP
jgi:hypothetical protein